MLNILLQAGGSPLGGLLPLLLVLVVMYFFFFRPQMKKQKEEAKFRKDGVTKGMRIVTTSGIHGKILDVDDATIILETENSRLKVEKSVISKELSAQYLPKTEKVDSKEKKK